MMTPWTPPPKRKTASRVDSDIALALQESPRRLGKREKGFGSHLNSAAGDRVTFAGQYGDIMSIGLRSVKLRTLDDSMVTIPNNMLLNEITTCGNYGVLNMQLMIDFLIGIDQNVHRAREIVLEAAVTSTFIYLTNSVEVLVSQVVTDGHVALQLRLKAYVLDTAFEKAFETDVSLRVMDTFRADNIRPPAILHRQVYADRAAAMPASGIGGQAS